MSLGILSPGQLASVKITLGNRGPQPAKVERIKTSCPCLRVEPQSFEVGSGEFAELVVGFDPSHDPDFRGGLSIEVTGLSTAGKGVFHARVGLEVQAAPVKASTRSSGSSPTIERGAMP